MRIALCSDELYPVHQLVRQDLERRHHEVVPFGALATGQDTGWAETAEAASLAIVRGDCEEGIFFCWSGTGISMAANKFPGIRAALCTDAETAVAARQWNQANVLCLSNRLLSGDLAREILAVWFSTPLHEPGRAGVNALSRIDQQWVRRADE